ncbi:unnamed protein product [Arabis nemorensis]|uniref:Uncharacterized protein n=1 Tax=Arabis nemorensis TaxID=586526 RepID=A0A565AR60_9BRAS|nr:unnamed protein product [Arabis nemorensis]
MKKEVVRDSLVHSRSAKVASEWEQEYLDGEYDGQKRKEPHRNDDRILRKDLGQLQDHLFQILQRKIQAQSPENRWYNSNQVETILVDAIQHARAQRPRIKLLQQSCCDYPMKNTACTNGKQVIDSGQANRVWERGRLWVGKVLCLELDSCEYKKQSKLVVEQYFYAQVCDSFHGSVDDIKCSALGVCTSEKQTNSLSRISCIGCVWDPGGISCSKAQEIWLGTYFPEYKKLIWLVVDQWLGVRELYALHRGVDDSVCLPFVICFGYKRLFDPGGANCDWEFRKMIVCDVLCLPICLGVHNRSFDAELKQKLMSTHQCLKITNLSWFKKRNGKGTTKMVIWLPTFLSFIHLENKVRFSGASNDIRRGWVSEAVKKKVRNVKDDLKMVKTSFLGDVRVTLAISMKALEFLLWNLESLLKRRHIYQKWSACPIDQTWLEIFYQKGRILVCIGKPYCYLMEDHVSGFNCQNSRQNVVHSLLVNGVRKHRGETMESFHGGSLLKFLTRKEARIDSPKGANVVSSIVEDFENPSVSIFTYEMFHAPRPP